MCFCADALLYRGKKNWPSFTPEPIYGGYNFGISGYKFVKLTLAGTLPHQKIFSFFISGILRKIIIPINRIKNI
jgi:hypothetical protein